MYFLIYLKAKINMKTNSENAGDKLLDSIRVSECADLLKVSGATIRNWIKTGYLQSPVRGRVSRQSIAVFKEKFSGKEKLNQRANKSGKDSHDHDGLVQEFLEKIQASDVDLSSIGSEYESSLSDSYRNKEGVYYTPEHIVDDLFGHLDIPLENKTFCDPCCGSGNFLIKALDLGFKPENIYGFDIDPVAVALSKKRIFEKTGYKSDNIKCVDFLNASISDVTYIYDCIFTNPPWGKKIDKTERARLGNKLNAGTSLDTCSLFYYCCLSALAEKGVLGLLLPESFLNVASYEDVRISLLSYDIHKIHHYGKPFRGLLTGAFGVVINKINCIDSKAISCRYSNEYFSRDSSSFKKNPRSIINVSCTSEESKIIEYLYSIPHVTLSNNASWALGIVTGNNEKFIEEKYRDGLVPVYKGSDITKSGLKLVSSYIPSDFSQYQQVAPMHFYMEKEKLIYRFISSSLCFYYDTECRYIINSANMLVVNRDFPVSMKILCGFLNSEIMSWLFDKIFKTHKVLRGDLELLPIHYEYLLGDEFNETDFLNSIRIERAENGTFRIKNQNNI